MLTAEMTIEEVMTRFPETIAVFRRFGLECNDCQIAAIEQIRHGASVHRVNVEELMQELNRATGHS